MDFLVCIENFRASYDGGTHDFKAGVTCVDPEHEVALRHPGRFRPATRSERLRDLERQAAVPGAREDGTGYPDRGRQRTADRGPGHQARDEALRTLDRHADAFAPGSDAEMERLVRHGDPAGVGARYLTAVGDADYSSAFGKVLEYGPMAQLRMTNEEVAAMQAVNAAERALNVGTGSAGQFAIPLQVDPSIVQSGSGSLNPWRSVATVRTMVSDTLRLVASDGVTAAYAAEATEASDNSPVLAQPTVNAARGQCFVPFSWEVGQDWGSLQAEVGALIADARDVVDSTKFTTGTGADEPVGLLAVGSTGSLTTSQRILSGATNTYAVADGWLLKAALPARAIPRATYAANPTTWDNTYRFVGGNSAEPLQMPSRGGDFLGRPKIEASAMVSTTTTGSKLIVAGDMKAFVIADRIGLSVSVVPHLFGAANRFPTGQGGLYAFWRTGSVVSAPNLFRYLEVK